MNCNNHPETPAAAYCQVCGKPLCPACVRRVEGSIFCESCLAEQLRAAAAGPAGVAPAAGTAPLFTGKPHPGLAALLGCIPGVGAMYNGQYAKAVAHVLIFAVLGSLSDHASFFGLLLAAWVFYQVFDAYQTAVARRDGLPLPNPFGLNDIAQRLGISPQPGAARPFTAAGPMPQAGVPVPPQAGVPMPPQAGSPFPPSAVGGTGEPYPPPSVSNRPAGWGAPGGAGEWETVGSPAPPPPTYAGFVPGDQAPPPPGFQGYPAGYSMAPPPPAAKAPVGAIILIGLGLLFLLGSLGILNGDWIGRGWPLLIIGFGVWRLYRGSCAPPPPAPYAPAAAWQAPVPGPGAGPASGEPPAGGSQ